MDEVVGVDEVLREHESAGSRFTAGGIESFVLRAGAGEPVVLMHGVPASSFLYRKVIPELATRGYDALSFDRAKARGYRLDIAAGTAVRFEPGQTRDVTLVEMAGKREVFGFQQKVMGKL